MAKTCLSNSFPISVQFGYVITISPYQQPVLLRLTKVLITHSDTCFLASLSCSFYSNCPKFEFIYSIKVSKTHFRGGAELLFGKTKKHDLILPQKSEPCKLIFHLLSVLCVF